MLALLARENGPLKAGNLSLRNLDDVLISRLKRRGIRHGRSAEAELRDISRQALDGEANDDFESLAAELRQLTLARSHNPAEILQREGRDER